MATVLFLLAAATGIGFVIWNYRKKAADREAASRKRFDEMFSGRRPAAATAESTAPASASAARAPAAPAAVAAPLAARDRFIAGEAARVYAALKAALPGHEVFAHVTLASVLAASRVNPLEERKLQRLTQYSLDFVVCDRELSVVAVVELEAAGGLEAAGTQRFKAESLAAAGIRMVRLSSAALPEAAVLRAQVQGKTGAQPV